MSYFSSVNANNKLLDQFGRLVISSPKTLLRHKQIIDTNAFFFDTKVNGTGSITYNQTESSSTLSVSTNGDYAIKQSKQRPFYEPGRSIAISFTGMFGNAVANTECRWGQFVGGTVAPYNTYEGVYISRIGTEYYVNVAKGSGVGAGVISLARANWTDKLDGTGVSGKTIDFTKNNIFIIEYKWLGSGDINFSVLLDRQPILFAKIDQTNAISNTIFQNPNLPIRYELRSTGGSSSCQQICASISLMSLEDAKNEFTHGVSSTAGITPGTNSATTTYGLIAVRKSSTNRGGSVFARQFSIATSGTTEIFESAIYLNPTIAGSVSWQTIAGSTAEYAILAVTNTITGGKKIYNEMTHKNEGENVVVNSNIANLGSNIDGTSDVAVLGFTKLAGANNSIYYGAMNIEEFI